MNPSPAILEAQYLAPIQYYSKFLLYERIIIEKSEHYSKGSFRKRCMLAMSNGVQQLSIPLEKGKNQQTLISEVKIDNSQKWQQLHWRTIQTAYGSAPFYEHYSDKIKPFYSKEWIYLFDYCIDFQNHILSLLKIKTDITFNESFHKNYKEEEVIDLRNYIHPKNFNQKDIDSNFKSIVYPQVFEDRLGFVSNLSILDLLFCVGPESKFYLNQSIKHAL